MYDIYSISQYATIFLVDRISKVKFAKEFDLLRINCFLWTYRPVRPRSGDQRTKNEPLEIMDAMNLESRGQRKPKMDIFFIFFIVYHNGTVCDLLFMYKYLMPII